MHNLQAAQQAAPVANGRAQGKLAGRVALITGAGRGLGGAIALDFARAGADLVICDIDMPALEETRSAVEAEGAACLALRCDITSSSEVAAMFASAAERFGTVHILVNNAAVAPTGAADEKRRNQYYAHLTTPQPRQALGFTREISDDDWHRYWNVNVHGMFYCTREALKLMSRKNHGAIVNLSSVAALTGLEVVPHYSAAKGAILAFTRAVARDVASRGIRVNAICPGYIDTPMTERMSPLIRTAVIARTPLRRTGEPHEVAATALFLVSDDSSFFTGQWLSPNGGLFIG
jgi:3-oxoacyl-[acyl-carrier protein] reductase